MTISMKTTGYGLLKAQHITNKNLAVSQNGQRHAFCALAKRSHNYAEPDPNYIPLIKQLRTCGYPRLRTNLIINYFNKFAEVYEDLVSSLI